MWANNGSQKIVGVTKKVAPTIAQDDTHRKLEGLKNAKT